MNYWIALYRFALGLLAILVVVVLVRVFLPKCGRLRELQREKVAVEEENRAMEERTRELRTKRERFNNDPKFVERTARETGMVKPDETVYKFMPAQEEQK